MKRTPKWIALYVTVEVFLLAWGMWLAFGPHRSTVERALGGLIAAGALMTSAGFLAQQRKLRTPRD